MMTLLQETERRGILTVAHRDYVKALNLHAFFKLNDHEIGEDLVQNTFLKTWKYLVKGGKIEMMKAFLYHILNHLIVDEYRKQKTASLDVLLDKGFEPETDDAGRIYNVIDGRAAIVLIKRIPIKYQGALNMRYVQELSLREMSVITGQTENAMAVQVHRGLEKLRLLAAHGASF